MASLQAFRQTSYPGYAPVIIDGGGAGQTEYPIHLHCQNLLGNLYPVFLLVMHSGMLLRTNGDGDPAQFFLIACLHSFCQTDSLKIHSPGFLLPSF